MKTTDAAYEYSRKSKAEREKRRASPKKTRKAFTVALLLALALAAAALSVELLMCHVALTEQNDLNVKLGAGLEELNEENRHLAIEYEQMIHLGELEGYAKNELGMCTTAQKQTEIIKTDTQDKAQIVKQDG